MYHAIYLPIEASLTDGCIVIDQSGKHFIYDENTHDALKDIIRPAELFLVHQEYNRTTIVGRPSEASKDWLKPGNLINPANCETWYFDTLNDCYSGVKARGEAPLAPGPVVEVIRVRCPVCGDMH